MTKRLLLPILLLSAQVAGAESWPAEARPQAEVSRSRREVRPEPPRPQEERTRPCAIVRASRPPRLAAAMPSHVDAHPTPTRETSASTCLFELDSVPVPSAAVSSPSPSRAPPVA